MPSTSFREHMRCIRCKRGKYGVGHNWICGRCREAMSNGYDPYTKFWNGKKIPHDLAIKEIEEYEKYLLRKVRNVELNDKGRR